MDINPTLRGSLKPAESREICAFAEDEFGYARMAMPTSRILPFQSRTALIERDDAVFFQ